MRGDQLAIGDGHVTGGCDYLEAMRLLAAQVVVVAEPEGTCKVSLSWEDPRGSHPGHVMTDPGGLMSPLHPRALAGSQCSQLP